MRTAVAIALTCLVGCRFGFDELAARDAAPIDSDAIGDVAIDGALGAFANPTKISVSLDTAIDDDPTLTGDLLELVFESDRPGGAGMSDLWITRRASIGAAWAPPAPIGELNSIANEEHPGLSADGLSLWFASDRTGGLGSYDVYVSTRPNRLSGTPWSTPQQATALNSAGNDEAPQVDPSELVMVMATGPNGQEDLRIATRGSPAASWPAPQPIDELDQALTSETAPMLSADLLTIYFSSNRNGLGNELFVASRPSPTGTFGTATQLTELDAAADQTDPWISPDQRTIVFVSEQDGTRDLFEATR